MRADKVVEEEKQGNEVVGTSEGRKALLGFVPCLELLVKGLNQVVGNVIVEALDADMSNAMDRFNRQFVSGITVADDGLGGTQRLGSFQQGKSLRAVPVAIEMEAEDETGLAVKDKPEVVFLALDLDHGFISVPLVGVEIERRDELESDVLEQRGKAGTPVADGCVGNMDVHGCPQDQGNIAEGILAQIEHAQGHEDDMRGITHPLEIRFSKELRHGRSRNSHGFWYKQGVVAFLVAAAVVAVIFPIVVKKGSLAANRAGRIILCSGIDALWCIRRPLVPTLLALVFLVSMLIFAISIKVGFVVALRTANLVYFCHEDSSPFGRYLCLW